MSNDDKHLINLDDAAKLYADTHTEWFDAEGNPHVAPAFKAGAEWMNQEMEERIKLIEEKIEQNSKKKMAFVRLGRWVPVDEFFPKSFDLVLAALFDVQSESHQYYVGWYNEEKKDWYLNDYGYTFSVTHWMPIPELDKPKV